jgi:3-dehydroquinate synthase
MKKTIEINTEIIDLQRYKMYIGTELNAFLFNVVNKYDVDQIVIIADENTHCLCLPLLSFEKDLNTIIFPAGEKHKNIETATVIWQQLLSYNIHRKGLIINLGGGVVGDMGGFCASVWNRGIDFIQIPTTLLAMVDASCGGKTAIDFENIKNQLGTFQMPTAVFVNPIFLLTLPQRELLSGVAEMIKHAIISQNDSHFQSLSKVDKLTPETIAPLISDSVAIKNAIVTADPFEKGDRKILNFGHTIGHAIETWSLTTKEPLLHGEAIALGMIFEIQLAENLKYITTKTAEKYLWLIRKFFGHVTPQSLPVDELISLMSYDKKNVSKQTLFAFPCENRAFKTDIWLKIEEIKQVFEEDTSKKTKN